MTTGSKRVLFSAMGLAVLLIAGLFIAQAGGGNGNSPEDGDSPSPTESSPSPESSPTPSSPKEQVRDAYLLQWDVYARAVEDLEGTGIAEVFTGKALQVVNREIRDRRRQGTPLRVRVKHDLAVKIVDATTAVVDDRYINHSVEFDPHLGKPTEPDPNGTIHEVYTLKKVNGTWKVSAIVRQSVQPRNG
ncbi:MAG: hypothetical protein ABR529_13905 [Actinomycetota bacterium]